MAYEKNKPRKTNTCDTVNQNNSTKTTMLQLCHIGVTVGSLCILNKINNKQRRRNDKD